MDARKFVRYGGEYLADPGLTETARELMYQLMQYPIGFEVSIPHFLQETGMQDAQEAVSEDVRLLVNRKYLLPVLTPENVSEARAKAEANGYIPPPFMTRAEHNQIIVNDWQTQRFTEEEISIMERKWLQK